MHARGKRVYSLVAVPARKNYDVNKTQVVFVDTRRVGLWPQWVAVRDRLFHPGDYTEGLQIPHQNGYFLVVRGGQKHDDQFHLYIEDGEVIAVVLQRTDELTPTSSGIILPKARDIRSRKALNPKISTLSPRSRILALIDAFVVCSKQPLLIPKIHPKPRS